MDNFYNEKNKKGTSYKLAPAGVVNSHNESYNSNVKFKYKMDKVSDESR